MTIPNISPSLELSQENQAPSRTVNPVSPAVQVEETALAVNDAAAPDCWVCLEPIGNEQVGHKKHPMHPSCYFQYLDESNESDRCGVCKESWRESNNEFIVPPPAPPAPLSTGLRLRILKRRCNQCVSRHCDKLFFVGAVLTLCLIIAYIAMAVYDTK